MIETFAVGTLALTIDAQPRSVAVWLSGPAQNRLLFALGDTRDEAVREAVARLEALTDALQQPSPAAIAALKE